MRSAFFKRDAGLVVWQIGMPGIPEYGTLDPEILIWCEENGFILVTNNRKSMPTHLADHLVEGRNANGILTLNEAMSVSETADELILIASASGFEEYQDLILYLPIT